jgi:hypothetical protein
MVDWSYSFSKNEKIPYGMYILYDLLPEIFPGAKLRVLQRPLYSVLQNQETVISNYIIVNKKFDPDPLSMKSLLQFIAQGNTLFLAAEYFGRQFSDTLGIKTEIRRAYKDSCLVTFCGQFFTSDSLYKLRPGDGLFIFSNCDSIPCTILAVTGKQEPCFIKLNYGKGRIFLATIPAVFCNYYLLYGNTADFVFKALSFLPVVSTMWDEYYKVKNIEARSPLRYILSAEALAWAYYLFIASVVLFIVFQGRRRQRIIPVFQHPLNNTLAFIKTIAQLYMKTGNHKIVARKKTAHLMAFLRSNYKIKSFPLVKEEMDTLSRRTGVSRDLLDQLSQLITDISAPSSVSSARLVYINQVIDRFYQQAKRFSSF